MSVESVRQRHEFSLKNIDGVIGVSNTGDKIIVYVTDESVIPSVPKNIEGIPVQINISGVVRPL